MGPIVIFMLALVVLLGACGIWLLREEYRNACKEEERTREWQKRMEDERRRQLPFIVRVMQIRSDIAELRHAQEELKRVFCECQERIKAATDRL